MKMEVNLCIVVAFFLIIFAVTLIKEDILLKINDLFKLLPKFVKIILAILTIIMLIFLIVFETMQFFK